MKHKLTKFCIEEENYWITKHSVEIKAVDLLAELASSPLFPKFYWDHRDTHDKIAAFGSLMSLAKMPSIKSIETIEENNFEPRFYGGLPFDNNSGKNREFQDFSTDYFFLPQYVIINHNSHFTLESYQIFETCPEVIHAKMPPLSYQNLNQLTSLSISQHTQLPTKEYWSQKIQKLIDRMNSSLIDKAVIARKTTLQLESSVCPFALLKYLEGASNGTLFAFLKTPHMSFLGASPECLYSRNKHHLSTEALAGTFSKQSTQTLNKSSKEHDEFRYVSEFLSQALNKFTHEISETPDKIRSMGYLKHIYKGYKASLSSSIGDSEIIKRLFPSPALCGHPKDLALEEINSLEDFDRHFYAAPIGWTSVNSAEFVIGIRSCILESKALHIFAGNGIISESDPLKEWEELDLKIAPFLNLIEYATT